MAIAIDASSPAVFTSAVAGATSASFTPPAGSLLVVAMAGNTGDNINPTQPTVADNRGAPLTYTLRNWRSRPDGSPLCDGQAAIWTAPCPTSVAMTVTVTSATPFEKACRVWVVTGQNTTNPIGTGGKSGSTSATNANQSYTATGTGSMGFMAVCDWTATGNPSAGTGTTINGGGVGAPDINYAFARRTSADGVNGVSTSVNVTLGGTSTDLAKVYLEILAQAGGAQTVSVGQVTETSTAQAVTWKKNRLIGQVTETSTSQALTRRKTLAVAQVVETSTANTMTRKKLKTLGQVSESSNAQTAAWKLTRLIGQIAETSTAGAVTRRKSATIGQISETSTAQVIGRSKVKIVGLVTETSTARSITRLQTIALGQVAESSTARIFTARKIGAIGQVTETSTSQAVGHTKIKTIGQVTESDTADTVTNPDGPVIIGTATESSTTQSVSVRKVRVISQVVETSTANGLARTKTKLLGQANETGLAQVIVRFNVPLIIQVNESDLARQVSGGTAASDTHGWRPLLGLHCVYLQQKTFGGSSTYIKRRSVKIIGFATDGYPILLCKQSGEQYGDASIGVRPRSHPDADEFDVYVSY